MPSGTMLGRRQLVWCWSAAVKRGKKEFGRGGKKVRWTKVRIQESTEQQFLGMQSEDRTGWLSVEQSSDR